MSFVTTVRFTLRDTFIRFPITDRPGDAARVAGKCLAVLLLLLIYGALAGSLEYTVTHALVSGVGPASAEIAAVTAASIVLFGIAVAWNVRIPALLFAIAAVTLVGNATFRATLLRIGSPQAPPPSDAGSLAEVFTGGNAFVEALARAFDPAIVVASLHLRGFADATVHGANTPLPALIVAWFVVALAFAGWTAATRRR